jgi:cytochrome c peroxidase
MYTAPYMHDGRFKTIEEVIDHYSDHLQLSPTVDPLMQLLNQGGSHMSASDKSDLIAFLKTLNDASFVNDTSFANPFK